MLLGLKKGENPHPPTTVYLMLGDKCQSNCAFCTQAKYSPPSLKLSRILWPPVEIDNLFKSIGNAEEFSRVCVQCLDYPELSEELPELIQGLKGILPGKIKISASVPPLPSRTMEQIKSAGADTVSIALDAANEELFEHIKGRMRGNRFTWLGQLRAMTKVKKLFGYTFTHLIVGLGESDRDIFSMFRQLKEKGIGVSLFAFTPVKGTALHRKAPDPVRYHYIQLADYLYSMNKYDPENAEFDKEGRLRTLGPDYNLLIEHIKDWDLAKAFMTRGCSGCNRPYYNERPQGPIYNYPHKPYKEIVIDILNNINEKEVI